MTSSSISLAGGDVRELHGEAAALEKSRQGLIERNLEALLGVTFHASEYSTGVTHGGRIDTLGIDENGSPVTIEYNGATNENVINQGLFSDAWIDESYTDDRDGQVGRVGYEINFNRYFYEYEAPRPLEEITADIRKVEKEIVELLGDIG